MAANEGRYPISAQCRLLGVARSTYYSMRSRADRPAAPDPAAPAVVAAHAASKGRYGSRKIKASLERSGVTVSRRRVCRIMRENGLVSAYGRKRFKVHPGAVNEADVPNVVARGFGGRAPRTHICSDLTYVRVGASWNYVCLLVDLYNREIVGHSAGPRKDARLVKSAFATLSFPISDIEVFHTDRGSEFDNAEIDLMLEAFGIERSLSAKGCPYDNAVDESTNRILKAELVHRETFGTTRELRAKLSDYVHWYNNFRIPLDAGLHVSGRVQGGGAVPPEIVQIGVANPRRGWRRARAGGRPRAPRRGPASRRGTLCCGTGRRRRACRRARRRTARRARPPCCGRGRWPAPPRRGRSGRPSATTCRRPGRARPRVWWMALSRWYPSGSRSTGWPPPRHSHYQPRRLPGTFLSAVGGGASRAGSTQQALSGAGTFGRARAPGRRPVLGAPQS